MGTNAEFEPFEYVGDDGETLMGFDIDYAKYLCATMGYDLEIENMDFDALPGALQSGKVDFLAAGIGNIHGVYPANWKGLDFEALDRIHKATNNIPLVLHGGTGIPDEMIQKAISLGVSKININTECQLVFAEATRKYIEEGKDQQGKGFDPRKLLAPGAQAIVDKCKEKIELFGCAGKG